MAVTLSVTFCVYQLSSGSRASRSAPKIGLPKSDTVAPRIGQYGPMQADMIASRSADLRVWVELRGFEPLTPSMRTERAASQKRQVTAFAQFSGLRKDTITASEAA
jgi:hypothetical protein